MALVEYKLPRVKKISQEDWAAALQPDTPDLPWTGPGGTKIVSFILAPVPECMDRTTIVFMDEAGNPVDIFDAGPMAQTVRALGPVLGEVTFLPDPGPRAKKPHWGPRAADDR
jgi:hypothetical protein